MTDIKIIVDKPISSIMNKVVMTASMDDTVEDVETLMKSHHVSSVPVYDTNGAILGIVTATDLLKFQKIGKSPKDMKAWEICSYKPAEVTPDNFIKEVAELMVSRQIHHVIVMENGSLQGIVSSLDFTRLCMDQNN